MRKSFNIFAAVTVTALAFSLASQPVEAATYTWRTSGSAVGGQYASGVNWVGGVAAVSNTASTTLQFTSNTTTGSQATASNVTGGFGVQQFLVDGTTTYNQTGKLNFGSGGLINNTSTVLQMFGDVVANNAGFSVTSTSGTLSINLILQGSGTAPNVSFTGLGQKFVGSSVVGITNISGPLSYGSQNTGGPLTLTGGSFYAGTNANGELTVSGGFLGNSNAMLYVSTGTDMQSQIFGPVDYNGLNMTLNLDFLADSLGVAPETYYAPLMGNADSYTGNLSSLVSTATSAPYAGLTWSQLGGGVWQSSVYNTNQQLEFRSAEGAIYVVPEPTQMVFVAGVAAAFGAWRMRKLRRNARGSNATAC